MDKQEATARLDAIEREAKELRKIIEAEPKREPRGLCWVYDKTNPSFLTPRIRLITRMRENLYIDDSSTNWEVAVPLTEAEMQEYRGRWE